MTPSTHDLSASRSLPPRFEASLPESHVLLRAGCLTRSIRKVNDWWPRPLVDGATNHKYASLYVEE